MSCSEIILDNKIRDWVLIPIVLVVFLVSILRHYITKLMKVDVKMDLKSIKENQILLRSKRLRTNFNKIPYHSFLMRKYFFNNKENGIFKEKENPSSQDPFVMMTQNNPMMDPNKVMEMMKGNMAMIIPQLFLMFWINHFFSGFVLVKLPFPLMLSFKPMLQRGIDINTLDVTYVSSLSWYFLTLFGSRGLNSIILGENNLGDDAQLMQQQMQGSINPQMDINQIFQSERENLELIKYEWNLENIEKRLCF
jgi:hypothetical protein